MMLLLLEMSDNGIVAAATKGIAIAKCGATFATKHGVLSQSAVPNGNKCLSPTHFPHDSAFRHVVRVE